MCHPTILWYGCDHLTLTQLKCPLDVLNMEHTFDDFTLACSGDACCLCSLTAIPNIQELRNNWLSGSKVAKFFKVGADDVNMESFITLFFEKRHHVQCGEYAALGLDGATASRSPPASESSTPAPEPAVEPTQVPSPRSPIAKQTKHGRPASQIKQPQNTQKNKGSMSKQSKTTTTTTAQSQVQAQVAQRPPTAQPTPVIQPKPMAAATDQTHPQSQLQAQPHVQCAVQSHDQHSQPTPAFQPVPTPQKFSKQPFPTPVSPTLLKTEEDAFLAETFLRWKNELDLAGGKFTDVDFEDIQAYIELEEKSGTKHGNQGPIQGLTGAGAAFDAELEQVSQPPIARQNVQAQAGRVQNPAHTRVDFDAAVQEQQPRPIQTLPAADATFQQQCMDPHYDAHLQAQRPLDPSLHAQQSQQNTISVNHATQNLNINSQLSPQRASAQHAAGSSVTHPVQHTAQRPVNVNTHAQPPLQDAPIQHPSGHAHPQHPIHEPACVNVHAQRPQQPNTPTQHGVQSVPQQRSPPQPVSPQAVPQQNVPIQNTAPQKLHSTTAHPEQATPYDGTNWGDKGVYLPDKNVYFAGDKPHSPSLDAPPLPGLDTTFPLSESDSLALQGRLDEHTSFLEFTNINEFCNESIDSMMLDVAASSEQYTATAQSSQGQSMHQPIDPLLANQHSSQVAYNLVQNSGSRRSTPSHMSMSKIMNTQTPAVHQFVQQPAQIVFHQNDTNTVTRLSSEEKHQIATATKPKRKGRGRPRKAQTASVKIVDNGNGTASPNNGNARTASTASTTATSTATTSTTTIANDPTLGISKTTAATSRIAKQSTTSPASSSITATKPRSRSNSNARTNTTTTTNGKGKSRSRITKKKEDNEPKGTLVTIERPPADNTADPTEEYIQRYSNPVAMLSPCSN